MCETADVLSGAEWLDQMQRPGWRRFNAEERANIRVIFETFLEHGYSPAVAAAAIVNAWSESAFEADARMSEPFHWKGRDYPYGTGAIGLFQLLPSPGAGGGPAGPERGYSRTFEDGRYAGTRWQALRYGKTPDYRGRRYYDGTDPRLNTERIILEVERDGARLLAADRRGASIAELSYIFGRDIERPHVSCWSRRRKAAQLFGRLAMVTFPNLLFSDEPVSFGTCSTEGGPHTLAVTELLDETCEDTSVRWCMLATVTLELVDSLNGLGWA